MINIFVGFYLLINLHHQKVEFLNTLIMQEKMGSKTY